MKNVAILIPYFGAWPRWFDLWLETCRRNPDFDFMFLTDIKEPEIQLPNVHYIPYTLEKVSRQAEKVLGMEVDIAYPFKVCDFRPAFGEIFQDIIRGYEFWGWGDIDVFYGDIGSFITHRILQNYDIISVREGFLAGELTLMRNWDLVNRLYQRSPDHKEVFAKRESFNFSEKGFFKNKDVDSITHVVQRAEAAGEIKTWLHTCIRTDRKIKGQPFTYYWKDGKLRDLEAWEDLLMYHFLDNKKRKDYAFEARPGNANGWLMNQEGIFPAPEGFEPKANIGSIVTHRTIDSLRALRRNIDKFRRQTPNP